MRTVVRIQPDPAMPSPITYPDHITKLKPYLPGLPIDDLARRLGVPPGRIVKLASNENPLGASPKARQALAQAALDPARYPDNDCAVLTSALSEHCQVPPEWLVVGAGSESVIGTAVSVLLAPGRRTLYSQYSFQAYVNSAQRVGATPIVVPAPEYTVDLDGLRAALRPDVSVVYIANPGNPTGTALSPDALEAFIAVVPENVVIVLDEAYFEYLPAGDRYDSVGWVRRHPNLLVTRTFSKAYGLAGLRVGYGIGQPALMGMLQRARAPFSVTEYAQIAAAAALQDTEFLRQTVEVNRRGLDQLGAGLDALGLRHLASSTNFVLVDVGDGAGMAHSLEQHALIVRPVASYGLPSWLRVTVGLPEENERLLSALAAEIAKRPR